MRRRAARIDENQPEIVAGLRAVGASVEPRLATLGKGAPDLLVGFRGLTFVMEVKDPAKPASRRRLTPDELVWHAEWAGQVAVVQTLDDALRVIGAE